MTKLNLGCCDIRLRGCVNVDIFSGPAVDKVADLTLPWPWEDNEIEYIVAYHIIEHLPNKIFTMNEAWRVLENGGVFDIKVPTTNGMGAWQDPTHVSFWNKNSFMYYEHGNSLRNRFGNSYGITASFAIVKETLDRFNYGEVLSIQLKAVK